VNPSQSVVKCAFRQRFDEVRDDLENGRIKFWASPEVWVKKQLDITALNCVLLLLAKEAKWN